MPKIELLNVDCMLYMATLPDKSFDLAVVDPPYGNNTDVMNLDNGKSHAAKRTLNKEYENIAPKPEYFLELKRVSKHQIIWGANWFGIKGGYLCWNKNGTAFGEAELAYCSMFNSVRLIEITWNGMIQHDMKNKETRIHTHQKPVRLYRQLLNDYAKPGDRILDTHLGSGSSAIAAHQMGFDFVGCELDKDYYDAACKRFKEQTKQLSLL